MSTIRPALIALALFSAMFCPPALAQLLLAPGKSVVVVDARDTSMRVVITAPQHEPLNLSAFFGSADPKDGVLSLVAHRQMARLMQGADGAIAIGPQARAAGTAGTMIDEGVVALQEGMYVLIQGVLSKPSRPVR